MDNPKGQALPDGRHDQHHHPPANHGSEQRERLGRILRSPEKSNRTTNNRKSRSLTTFLLDSDIKSVVFLGKCVQQFGWGAVIGFCLGAAGVYGYAFTAKSLPLVPFTKEQSKDPPAPTPAPVVSQRRWLHGDIKSDNEDIEIGVLAQRNGPFPSGSFSMEVPQGDHYQVVLWNPGYRSFRVVELRPDVDGKVPDLKFPSDSFAFQSRNQRNSQTGADTLESTSTQLAARSARSTVSQLRSSFR